MEQEEIKEFAHHYIIDILKSKKKSFLRPRYTSFLSWLEMENRRNIETLNQLDRYLKKYFITFKSGHEERDSILDFTRDESITFELDHQKLRNKNRQIREAKRQDLNTPSPGEETLDYEHAGTITVEEVESGIVLHKHQKEAIDHLNDKILKTEKTPFAGLVVLPTGGGKTLTAAYWLSKNYLNKGKKILWIAHRHELLNQAKSTFHHKLAFKDIFTHKKSINYRVISGIHDKPVNIKSTDDIIISSKDSINSGFEYLYNNWLKGNEQEIMLVVDEAHHAAAKTYRKLIDNLKGKVSKFRMIGLTATPFRTLEEEQGLLAKVFPDNIVYSIDLRTLVQREILAKPKFETVKTEFDMTRVLTPQDIENITHFDIDSIGSKAAKTIAENVPRNHCIVDKYVKQRSKYKQTIVFALNQDNAIALTKLFVNKGVAADYVLANIKDLDTGVSISSKENSDKIEKFRNGVLEVLINVNILTEGTDLPKVQSVFLARPTISPILMTQMIGRGLRGVQAGGTKEAFIVSFIDDWKDKFQFVNPKALIEDEDSEFDDEEKEKSNKVFKIISISKLEEFAELHSNLFDPEKRAEIEKLEFIERIPVGLYHFSLASFEANGREIPEKNCDVLIYDNLRQAYIDFINALPEFFKENDLESKEFLTEAELTILSDKIEMEFFLGTEIYPGYNKQDLRNIIQYYAQKEAEPKFIELEEREKYNIAKVAAEIISKDLGPKSEEEMISRLWENHESEWKAFFGFDKKYYLNEIDLAKRRLLYPDLYQAKSVIPNDQKELRQLQELPLYQIKEQNEKYWRFLSDQVFLKHKDEKGFYKSANGTFKSKNKLAFQIDHIIPISKGGKTVLENLQLLTRAENGLKGNK